MLFHQFPDLQWLKRQAEQKFRERRDATGRTLPTSGWPNVILNVETSNVVRDNIRGPLTLFMNVKGNSHVEVNGKRWLVQEDFFFISNHDQYYTLEISKKQQTETFNIHFGESFIDQTWQSILNTEGFLLENEFQRADANIAFHNRLCMKSASMNQLIAAMKSNHQKGSLFLEEDLFQLAALLLAEENKLLKRARSLPPIKRATQLEILRRLTASVDFIYENFQRDIALEDAARIACMSKFHYLRLFKVAYGKTPGQFIDSLRIEQAKSLLLKSTIDVASLSQRLGYKNPSSFSRLFKNQLGVYPTQFRQQ
jgi:AraC family transcriptional regulator